MLIMTIILITNLFIFLPFFFSGGLVLSFFPVFGWCFFPFQNIFFWCRGATFSHGPLSSTILICYPCVISNDGANVGHFMQSAIIFSPLFAHTAPFFDLYQKNTEREGVKTKIFITDIYNSYNGGLKGQQAFSTKQRLGPYLWKKCRPVRAKALTINAFALEGRQLLSHKKPRAIALG